MAYPDIEGTAATSNDSDRSGTTLSMNVPAFVSTGEVLVAFVCQPTASGSISFPAGWVSFMDEDNGGSNVTLHGAAKLATGSESGTISVTVASAEVAGIMYRVSGAADPNFEPPIYGIQAYTTNRDYMAGAEVYEFRRQWRDWQGFALAGLGNTSGQTIQEYPENYSNTGSIASGGAGTTCELWYGHRDVRGPMEVLSWWDFAGTDIPMMNAVVLVPDKSRALPTSNFPYVKRFAHTADAGRTTSTNFRLQLPTCDPGDIMIGYLTQHDQLGDTVTWPSGWNEVYDNTNIGVAGQVNMSAAWRKCDGSEDRSIDITVAPDPLCGLVLTVGNCADPDVSPPEWETEFENDTGFSNLGALTPTGGLDNYLWIAAYHWDSQSNEVQTWPSGFESGRLRVDADYFDPALGTQLWVCWTVDEIARSTLNPTNFEVTSTDFHGASLVAIYPGAFDQGDWWYLNWRHKGRNGFM